MVLCSSEQASLLLQKIGLVAQLVPCAEERVFCEWVTTLWVPYEDALCIANHRKIRVLHSACCFSVDHLLLSQLWKAIAPVWSDSNNWLTPNQTICSSFYNNIWHLFKFYSTALRHCMTVQQNFLHPWMKKEFVINLVDQCINSFL